MNERKIKNLRILYITVGLTVISTISFFVSFKVGAKQNKNVTAQIIPTATITPLVTPISTQQISKTSTTSQNPSPTEILPTYKYHLYGNPHVDISKVKIIGVFLKANDQNETIKDEWSNNIEDSLSRIVNFYSKQFDGKIQFKTAVSKDLIISNKAKNEDSLSNIAKVVKEKTINLQEDGYHNTWIVFHLNSSDTPYGAHGSDYYSTAVDSARYLDNPSQVVNNGVLSPGNPDNIAIHPAHEFGHVLGLPHPWELPENTSHDSNFGNVPEDIMSYTRAYLSLDQMYVRDDMKKEMGF